MINPVDLIDVRIRWNWIYMDLLYECFKSHYSVLTFLSVVASPGSRISGRVRVLYDDFNLQGPLLASALWLSHEQGPCGYLKSKSIISVHRRSISGGGF